MISPPADLKARIAATRSELVRTANEVSSHPQAPANPVLTLTHSDLAARAANYSPGWLPAILASGTATVPVAAEGVPPSVPCIQISQIELAALNRQFALGCCGQ